MEHGNFAQQNLSEHDSFDSRIHALNVDISVMYHLIIFLYNSGGTRIPKASQPKSELTSKLAQYYVVSIPRVRNQYGLPAKGIFAD